MKKYKAPYENGYTIYTISNCNYCKMINENIISNKKIINFYKFIQQYTKIPYKYFPMLFKNGIFIGGYKEWLEYKSS